MLDALSTFLLGMVLFLGFCLFIEYPYGSQEVEDYQVADEISIWIIRLSATMVILEIIQLC